MKNKHLSKWCWQSFNSKLETPLMSLEIKYFSGNICHSKKGYNCIIIIIIIVIIFIIIIIIIIISVQWNLWKENWQFSSHLLLTKQMYNVEALTSHKLNHLFDTCILLLR